MTHNTVRSLGEELSPLWRRVQWASRSQRADKFEERVWPYRLIVPFLFGIGAYVQMKKWLYRCAGGDGFVPRYNFWLVDGISINSRRVRDGAMRWKALDAVYNFGRGEGGNCLSRMIDHFWLHVRNAQAVRNRLKIVKRELSLAVRNVAAAQEPGRPVRILSIAAGSGQGVIETVAELKRAGFCLQVLLVDRDQTALAHARKLAARHGVEDIVTACEGDAVFFNRVCNFRPCIIEMCGLMDYLRDATAIALIKKIHRYLKPEGYFLTCHIHPNLEAYFLRHVENWGMLYRSREELLDLIVKGGFLGGRPYTEPLKIHTVVVARKEAQA